MAHRRGLGRLLLVATLVLLAASLPACSLAQSLGAPVEAGRQLSPDHTDAGITTSLIIINGFLVFFMQVGFLAFETGSGRAKNVRNILLKNLLDVMLAALAWWAVGYAFAYGTSAKGVIGTNLFFYEGEVMYDRSTRPWFFSWTFCIAACTIISGCLAERTALAAYPAATLAIAAVVHPLLVHWVWSPQGWMTNSLGECHVLDFAGGMVVHMLGGLFGLVGAWKCGPRLGRFELVQSADEADSEPGSEAGGGPACHLGLRAGQGEQRQQHQQAQQRQGGEPADSASDLQQAGPPAAAAAAGGAAQPGLATAPGATAGSGHPGLLGGAALARSAALGGQGSVAAGASSSDALELAALGGPAAAGAGPAGPASGQQCPRLPQPPQQQQQQQQQQQRKSALSRILQRAWAHPAPATPPGSPAAAAATAAHGSGHCWPWAHAGARRAHSSTRCLKWCRGPLAPKAMPGHDMAFVTLGTFMLWFGWFGFNNGSVYMYVSGSPTSPAGLAGVVSAEVVQRTSMNTSLGGAAGGLAALLMAALFSGTYDLRVCCNGVLSGLVTVTCMCGFIDPWAAVVCSALAGALYTGMSCLLLRLGVDDPLDSSAVHLGNGLLGTLLLAVFAKPEHVQALTGSPCGGIIYDSSGWTQLALQLMAVAVVVAFAGGAALLLFSGLDRYGLLRVDQVTELAGIDNMDHGGPAYPNEFAGGGLAFSAEQNAASSTRRLL